MRSSGSGGDALPWMFKQAKLGLWWESARGAAWWESAAIPVLMDGGRVTSPSVAFFSPAGQWDVENHGVEPDIASNRIPSW